MTKVHARDGWAQRITYINLAIPVWINIWIWRWKCWWVSDKGCASVVVALGNALAKLAGTACNPGIESARPPRRDADRV